MFVPSMKLIEAERKMLSVDLAGASAGDAFDREDLDSLRMALKLLQEAQVEMNERYEAGRLIEVWGGKKAVIVNKGDTVTIKPAKF